MQQLHAAADQAPVTGLSDEGHQNANASIGSGIDESAAQSDAESRGTASAPLQTQMSSRDDLNGAPAGMGGSAPSVGENAAVQSELASTAGTDADASSSAEPALLASKPSKRQRQKAKVSSAGPDIAQIHRMI